MPGEAESLRKLPRTQRAEGSVRQSPGHPRACVGGGLGCHRTRSGTGQGGPALRWRTRTMAAALMSPTHDGGTRGGPVSAGCPGDSVITSWAPVTIALALGCKPTCARLPDPTPWFSHRRGWAPGRPGAA